MEALTAAEGPTPQTPTELDTSPMLQPLIPYRREEKIQTASVGDSDRRRTARTRVQ